MFFPHNDGTTDMEKWLRKCNSFGPGRNMAEIRIKSNKKPGEKANILSSFDFMTLFVYIIMDVCVCIYFKSFA